VFPDQGQKDFDIYNVDYKHVLTAPKTVADESRHQQVKAKLTKELYLSFVLQKAQDQKQGEAEIDEEFGFPIGIHENFDNFIEIFKREKKVGSNVIGEFESLVLRLMHKFEAKSEVELIKIFRFNLANTRKHSLQDKLRSLALNSAFIKFLRERKLEGLPNDAITLEQLHHFQNADHVEVKRPAN
jgi:hypothetical protein